MKRAMGRPPKKRKAEYGGDSEERPLEPSIKARKTRSSKTVTRSAAAKENANQRCGPEKIPQSKLVSRPEKSDTPHEEAATSALGDAPASTIGVSMNKTQSASRSSEQPNGKRPRRTPIKKEAIVKTLDDSERRRRPVQPKVEAKQARSARGRGRVQPVLKKEPSEAAEAALKRLAEKMNDIEESDSDSSTASISPSAKRNNTRENKYNGIAGEDDDDNDDDDDEMFEDVDLTAKAGASAKFDTDPDDPGDLELTLEKAERLQLVKPGKKKHSVRAIHERCFCHYMSTIAMVAVGACRNAWANDDRIRKALRRVLKAKAPGLDSELMAAAQNKSSHSFEFVELMGRVMKKWGTIFHRTKPGLRKLGHRQVSQMDAGREFEQQAESFSDLDSVVDQATKLEGSRDFGALLFTALLRAYHFRVRLIFSTQPLGYKFNDREEFNMSSLPRASLDSSRADNNPSSVKSTNLDKETRDTAGLSTAKDVSGREVVYLDTDSENEARSSTKQQKHSRQTRSGKEDDAISLDESDLTDLNSEDLSDLDLLTDPEDALLGSAIKKPKLKSVEEEIDADLEYPIFWTEVFDTSKQCWIAVDAMVKKAVFVDEKGFKSLHPRGAKAEQQKLTLGFVVAYDANKYAKDVTVRYASSWAKVKDVFLRADGKLNTRYDVNKILVRMGNPYRDKAERNEDDSLAFKEVKRPSSNEMPKSLADFKSSAKYILDKHLREKEALRPGAKSIDVFTTGKGAKETTSKVYLRKDVVPCKTIENYHKEGLRIKEGEQPRKMIKARAMTTNRIREHQQQLAETGEEHVMQGIYSLDQTEYIIPPPIKDGIIPKNAYGNADVFVESMIPQGATHLKLKGVARIARKLEIDHAEAVVGFEFKKRGAIPLVLGVLVADENAATLQAAWEEAEELRIRREDKKRTEAALKLWAKMLKGLRIRTRINAEYGILVEAEEEEDGTMNIPEAPAQKTLKEQLADTRSDGDEDDYDERQEGGFVR